MNKSSDLRLIFPLWLGGNLPAYEFGAEMLAWLAPETASPVVRVPVAPVSESFDIEQGIRGRSEINAELDSARDIIQAHHPERLTVIGGDCLADLEPFAWLSQKWGEGFGILWIDTHPDVMTPAQYENAHAHVLGALMGNGDPDLTQRVTQPVPASNVFIAGIHSPTDYEAGFLAEHHIRIASPEQIVQGQSGIREWIEKAQITHLAIHFDLDVLDYHKFRAVMFARNDKDAPSWDGVAKGKLELDDVLHIIREAEQCADIVGLGITEHLPWDAINLRNALARLPLFRS